MEDFSSGDEDWEDELPLATIRELDRVEPVIRAQGGEDSDCDSDRDSDGDSDGADDVTAKSSATAPRRWVPVAKDLAKTPRTQPKMGINTDQVDLTKVKTPLDFFRLFFTLEFVGRVVESTNTYTEQVRAAKPEKHKSKWVPADTASLIKFKGLTFIMGVLKKARIKDYWMTTPELATPFFGHVMKRDRFVVLLRYLNFGRQTPAATPMTS